jgi:hypothetical protein
VQSNDVRAVNEPVEPRGVDVDRVIFTTEQEDGVPLQVVQCHDGMWAIAVNGALMAGRRWEPREVESCIRTYLKMLRFTEGSAAH